MRARPLFISTCTAVLLLVTTACSGAKPGEPADTSSGVIAASNPVSETSRVRVTKTSTETIREIQTVTTSVTVTDTTTVTAPPPDIAADFADLPPPETLSLRLGNTDLFTAAEDAAATVGVLPADPDTPGPASGDHPAPDRCAANDGYFDEEPTGLRSDAALAWRVVQQSATAGGIAACLNDGKRSKAQQQAVFDEYVAAYSLATAEELVLQPDKSMHVVGLAIDVQPAAAYQWLSATEGALGYCRTYDNEPWHFEFHPAYPYTGCPDRLPEPPR